MTVARWGTEDAGIPLAAPSPALALGPSAPASASPTPAVGSRLDGGVIVLRRPWVGGGPVRSRDLVVSGHLVAGTGPVSAIVSTATGERIAARTVGPLTVGRPSDDPNPVFMMTVPLGDPRPSGELQLRVVAYDLAGRPVDVVRRWIVVGPLVRRAIGEDGLVGGRLRGGS